MNILINISEEEYKNIQSKSTEIQAEGYILENAVLNGTPIPDNATFGDVIEKITNRKPLEDNKNADNIIISTKLWDAPYQKGGKE